MSLATLLFRPKWRSKRSDIRLTAVRTSQDPALLSSLADIARADDERNIRIAAIKRITDLDLLQEIGKTDSDSTVMEAANRHFLELLCDEANGLLSSAHRLSRIDGLGNSDHYQFVATSNAGTELRKAAIRHLNKPGILGELAMADPDPQLRLLAIEHINQTSTLERISKQLRKKDKQAYRTAQNKLNQLRIAAGDETLILEQGHALLDALGQLVANPDMVKTPEALTEIESRWALVSNKVPKKLKQSFEGSRQVLLKELSANNPAQQQRQQESLYKLRAGLLDDLKAVIAVDPAAAEYSKVKQRLTRITLDWREASAMDDPVLEHDLASQYDSAMNAVDGLLASLLATQPVAAEIAEVHAACERAASSKVNSLSARNLEDLALRLEKLKSRNINHNSNERQELSDASQILANTKKLWAKHEQTTADLAGQVPSLLSKLEADLEDKNLFPAWQTLKRLQEIEKQLAGRDQKNQLGWQKRLATARHDAHELRNWQRWSHRQLRERLIDELEMLTPNALHPDAVAEKVKAAQLSWKALDGKEKSLDLFGDKASGPALWKRFQTSCNRLYEPAKGFFKKRAEIQGQQFEQIESLVKTSEVALQADDKDWKEIETNSRELKNCLRDLGAVPPAKRGNAAGMIRATLDRADKVTRGHHEEVLERKRRIVAEAEEWVSADDLTAAIEQAKALQQRWKASGSARRSDEQKLWKQFRAHCDAIFGRLDAEKAEQKQQQRAALEPAIAALKDLEALASAATGDIAKRKDSTHKAWLAAPQRPKNLQTRWDKAMSKVEASEKKARNSLKNQVVENLQKRAELCAELEAIAIEGTGNRDKTEKRWQQLPVLDKRIEQPVLDRWQWALETVESAAAQDPSGITAQIDAAQQKAERLLIKMEFLSGTPTPDAFAAARMDFQVKRLASKMAGGESMSQDDEMTQALRDWYATGPLTSPQRKSAEQRFEKIMAAQSSN